MRVLTILAENLRLKAKTRVRQVRCLGYKIYRGICMILRVGTPLNFAPQTCCPMWGAATSAGRILAYLPLPCLECQNGKGLSQPQHQGLLSQAWHSL